MTLLRLTLKNIFSNWIRFLMTGLAVVLGVGFVVGTFVITDGLRSTFGDLAEDIASGADLFLGADQEFGNESLAAPVDPALVDEIQQVEGVANAEGLVFRPGVNVVGPDGESIGSGFTAGLSFGPANATFLVTEGEYAGTAPSGPNEFAVNRNVAQEADLVIGDTYVVDALGGAREMELSGVFNWADPESDRTVGGLLLALDLETSLDFLAGGAGLSQVGIILEDGADEAAVISEVTALAGDGFEVITNEQSAEEQAADFDEILDIFGTVLLTFAIITLFVSAFIIYNTFSIVIGQRIREVGLLRAIGATGRQVVSSLIGESVVVGILATIVGIFGGLGIALILRAVLNGLGADFPSGPLPLQNRTIILASVMGIGVTVLSAVVPALRARRIPPIAALRDDVTIGQREIRLRPMLGRVLVGLGVLVLAAGLASGTAAAAGGVAAAILLYLGGSRIRSYLGRVSILVIGLVLLVFTAIADLETGPLLGALAVGALLTFIGVNLVSPLFAKPFAALIGTRSLGVVVLLLGVVLALATLASLFGAATSAIDGSLGATIGLIILAAAASGCAWLCWTTWRAPWGVEGPIARGNAGRSPRRTASTAAALMIGLALVGTVSVLGNSIKATFTAVLDRSVAADWFICLDECASFFDGFSPAFGEELKAETTGQDPLFDSVVAYRFAEEGFRTVADDTVHDVFAADFEDLEDHLDADFLAGGAADAAPGALLLHEDPATDRGLEVGDPVELLFASGEPATFTVAGIYTDARILGNWVISNTDYLTYLPPGEDQFVSVVTSSGVDEDDARARLEAIAEAYPGVEIRTKDEYRDLVGSQVDQALVTINVFLALALIIALVGIANTLALSVFERTREIGLFRAVGATRTQTSMLIRWEGAIIAVFGGLLGLALGVVFGIIAVIVTPDSLVTDVAIPWIQLVIYLVVAALAGLVAAYLPARRAAKLNVLDAISQG